MYPIPTLAAYTPADELDEMADDAQRARAADADDDAAFFAREAPRRAR